MGTYVKVVRRNVLRSLAVAALVVPLALVAPAGAAMTFTTLVSSNALGYSEGLALDPAGNLFIASYYKQVVLERSAVTGLLTTVASLPAPVKGLAFDGTGNLYLSVQGSSNLLYRESASVLAGGTTVTPGNGLTLVATLPSGWVGGLAFTATGDLVIAVGSGVVALSSATLADPATWPVAPGSGVISVLAPIAAGVTVLDVALDASGNLFAAAGVRYQGVVFEAPASVVNAALAGTPIPLASLSLVTSPLASGVQRPVGIKVDVAGDLIIVDGNSGYVDEISALSAATAAATGTPVTPSQVTRLVAMTPSGMQLGGLAIATNGILYVGTGVLDQILVGRLSEYETRVAGAYATSAVVTSVGVRTQSITASWGGGPGPYRCVLLDGFGTPTTFSVATSSSSCTFGGLALGQSFGISVSDVGTAGPAVEVFAPPARVVLTCVRDRHVRRVAGTNPRCPLGWRLR